MTRINQNFQKIPGSYLFAEIARRQKAYLAQTPDKKLLRLGIGDVTRPLAPSVIAAMHAAVDEMSRAETFRGYPDYEGNLSLRQAIVDAEYGALGLSCEEIFISDGAKSDTAGFADILSVENKIAVCDPVYPVYVDSNAMAGRTGEYINDTWSDVVYMPCTMENGFVPALPEKPVQMIYLCSPNNPTGTVLTLEQLQVFVDYANEHKALILFDGAYEAFIREPNIPHSIYACKGAQTCAVEFRSFSKTAGFTGVRCAYTVIPKKLVFEGVSLNSLWMRRQSTKFNGVSYITQKGAEATFSPQGKLEIRATIDDYLQNARLILDGCRAIGLPSFGGVNSPYVWVKVPGKSWDFFDRLMTEAQVIGTPGSGFGPSGEGYFRLTAFGSRETTTQAIERIGQVLS